ncbi:Alkane 1-monooxygenase 1 [Galdieria sulphuraria]|nr:Alkane 1-monooxygenase 1 [Galdieria sulphuraria]
MAVFFLWRRFLIDSVESQKTQSAFSTPLPIDLNVNLRAHCSLFFHSGYGKWCSTLYVFVLVPILDLMFGKDYTNPSEEDEKFYKYNFQYTLPLLLWLPSELFLITKAAKYLNGDITFAYWLSSTIAVGLCSGIGIACAHELGHIPSRLCSFFSKGLLLSACYGSFAIEHNYGHHKNVGTDKDPTTAKLNESFYHFFFRSISGVVTNSWKTESKSLKRRGYSGISLFLRNQVLFDSIQWFSILLRPLLLSRFYNLPTTLNTMD